MPLRGGRIIGQPGPEIQTDAYINKCLKNWLLKMFGEFHYKKNGNSNESNFKTIDNFYILQS
jgi:hypothetical protein